MPNWSSAVSRSVSRWAFQVSTSLGATLVAALIVQSLPRLQPEAPAPAPELTSGGKFAARVASARAYDGLDSMPLPHVDAPRVDAPATIVPAAFFIAPANLAAIGAALPQPAVDGSSVRERAKPARLAHAPTRAEARRIGAAADVTAAPAGTSDATIADASDDGLIRQIASKTRQVWSGTSATTREVWTATASAGSSLVSRLVP